MDLLRLLEIDRTLLVPEAEKSLLLADRLWCEDSCPREPGRLVETLEKILQRCLTSGIWYAPILPRRKKALERDAWKPSAYSSAGGESEASRARASTTRQGKGDESCAACGGTGILVRAGGFTGTLCSCGIYLQRLPQR
ncbi:MAG TPA: hypothetical protein VMI32_12450 [Candidatus Solibacter sp.]|nr:hypothetical protein [Candidatus Solibacter sp.]